MTPLFLGAYGFIFFAIIFSSLFIALFFDSTCANADEILSADKKAGMYKK